MKRDAAVWRSWGQTFREWKGWKLLCQLLLRGSRCTDVRSKRQLAVTTPTLVSCDETQLNAATDVLLMSPPGLRPPQNWFSRRSCCYSHVSRVQVCVYMVKTSQIPDDITLKCTTSTMIANRPGCFPSTWKLGIFLGFLPASHKYVSSSEPQAFQNIQLCFTKSRYEAQLVQGDLQSPGSLIMFHDHVMETACFFFL